MRVRISGRRTPAELRELLNNLCDRLEIWDVPYVSAVNVYLTPADETGQELLLIGPRGEEIDALEYPTVRRPRKVRTAEVVPFKALGGR